MTTTDSKSRNPNFKPYGQDLQVVTRCVCGHVYEYHYLVLPNGSPSYDRPDANRCGSSACACARPEWDGQDPQRLPNVKRS